MKRRIPQRLKDLIGPYWDTYGIVYRVIQPLLDAEIFGRSSCFPLRSSCPGTSSRSTFRPRSCLVVGVYTAKTWRIPRRNLYTAASRKSENPNSLVNQKSIIQQLHWLLASTIASVGPGIWVAITWCNGDLKWCLARISQHQLSFLWRRKVRLAWYIIRNGWRSQQPVSQKWPYCCTSAASFSPQPFASNYVHVFLFQGLRLLLSAAEAENRLAKRRARTVLRTCGWLHGVRGSSTDRWNTMGPYKRTSSTAELSWGVHSPAARQLKANATHQGPKKTTGGFTRFSAQPCHLPVPSTVPFGSRIRPRRRRRPFVGTAWRRAVVPAGGTGGTRSSERCEETRPRKGLNDQATGEVTSQLKDMETCI